MESEIFGIGSIVDEEVQVAVCVVFVFGEFDSDNRAILVIVIVYQIVLFGVLQQCLQLQILFLLDVVEVEPEEGVDQHRQFGCPVLKAIPTSEFVKALSEIQEDLGKDIFSDFFGDD